MAEPGHNANAEIKRRAERRIKILNDIADLQDELKSHKKQDKEDGYNEKALAQCIRELRKDADYRADQLQLELELFTYRKALDLPVTLDAAQEAAREEAGEVPPVPEEEAAEEDDRKPRQRADLN